MDHSRVVVFVIIIFASLVISLTGVAADTAHETSAPIGQTSSTTVPITQQLQLNPETTGSIHVTTSVDVTLKLKQFGLYINDSAQRVTVDGFSRTNTEDSIAGYDRYEWDGNTRTPSISYNLNVNTTNDNGKYKTVDAGEWAIVEVPSVPYSWRASEEIEIVNDHEIDGSGVIKRGFAFLGDHAIRTATARDQQFRLVIPDAANLTESPEAILDNVAYASKQLQVGERDSDVVMIAAPTSDDIKWARGGTARDAIFWTQDTARLDSPDNIWLHEYIHTRQGFDRTNDFEWFAEGSAEYYAALFTLQQEQIGFEEFRTHLTVSDSRQANAILTKTKDSAQPQYTKGGLVAARSDQRIRDATNASLTEIFGRLNAADESVSNGEFLRYVRLYSSAAVESDIQDATTTTRSLKMWDRQGHQEAFGVEPHTTKSTVGVTDETAERGDSNPVTTWILVLVALNVVVYGGYKIYTG